MAATTWFLFDLGNTLIKLAYERVIAGICRNAKVTRDEVIEILEQPGGYRDMERGAVTFREFYEFLVDKTRYRGSLHDFRAVWSDFFDGTIPGMEDLLDRLRERYRIAFLSNSNEIHAELIPRRFSGLFRRDDRFVFSHRFRVAKPDPEIFRRALEVLGALPQHVVFIDDLSENVLAARSVGMVAYQFIDAEQLTRALAADGLL
ncbi:MAG: HAD family phosphatase [Acidobacteria bacterium]|nr:HAD family phosphatase [Acidobacteriota bacterium]MBV9474787.1 HAD family phosphatase [Acidobacteriota bacterium]